MNKAINPSRYISFNSHTKKIDKIFRKNKSLLVVLPIAACTKNNPVPIINSAQPNTIITLDDQGGFVMGGFNTNSLTVTGGNGNDSITTGRGNDLVDGGGGDDIIHGGPGNDTLNGGDGDDLMLGDAGADILDGGDGIDMLHYGNGSNPVNINLATGAASGGHAEGDIFSNFENVSGTGFDDTIIGDDQDNYLSGGPTGNDMLIGGGGNDILNGHIGFNILDGGDGDDLLIAYGVYTGMDLGTYDGGLGVDTLAFFSYAEGLEDLNIDLSNYTVSNIEVLDVTNNHLRSGDRAELITLTINDVLDVTDIDNELRIDGNANDSVTSVGQGWAQGADQFIDGETYNLYTTGGATLLIDEDIPQIIS